MTSTEQQLKLHSDFLENITSTDTHAVVSSVRDHVRQKHWDCPFTLVQNLICFYKTLHLTPVSA